MQNANGGEYCDGLRLKTSLAEMLKGGVIRWWTRADLIVLTPASSGDWRIRCALALTAS